MNQTRRTFFKTVAATCVGVVVAPAVAKRRGIDCNAPVKWTTVDCSPTVVANKIILYGKPGIGKTYLPGHYLVDYKTMNQLFGPGRCYCPRD